MCTDAQGCVTAASLGVYGYIFPVDNNNYQPALLHKDIDPTRSNARRGGGGVAAVAIEAGSTETLAKGDGEASDCWARAALHFFQEQGGGRVAGGWLLPNTLFPFAHPVSSHFSTTPRSYQYIHAMCKAARWPQAHPSVSSAVTVVEIGTSREQRAAEGHIGLRSGRRRVESLAERRVRITCHAAE